LSRLVTLPFFDVYGAILAWVFQSEEVETNKRTGERVKVGVGGTSFRIDLSGGLLPTIGYRKTFPRSAAAEVAWFLQGSQDASFITKYAPLWDKFVEEITVDPETAWPVGQPLPASLMRRIKEYTLPDGRKECHYDCDYFMGVKASYGYRWRNHFGRDQIGLSIEALRKDPTDRRCYVSAWDPAEDGLGASGQRNVPCPTGFTLSIQGGRLCSSMMLRSSDVFVGLPYDVMGHALLMDAVAQELRVRPGVMHVTLAHPHLYEHHWDMTAEALRQEPVLPALQLPGWKVSQIVRAPDDYVTRYGDEAKQVAWPSYNPKPHVVE
jgi:thymidylate synthase